ncbi:MAG: hypothetical protein MJE68_26770 [Proteobacteria bacterium]|nr:hypothetical protein [Pseudomonadota bacterium]
MHDEFVSIQQMVLKVNDLVKVLDELYDVRDRWYDIGLRLNVPAETLEEIRAPNDNSCLRQVLVIWLKSGKATWTDLCQVLRHRTIDKGELADSLLAKYQTGSI